MYTLYDRGKLLQQLLFPHNHQLLSLPQTWDLYSQTLSYWGGGGAALSRLAPSRSSGLL